MPAAKPHGKRDIDLPLPKGEKPDPRLKTTRSRMVEGYQTIQGQLKKLKEQK